MLILNDWKYTVWLLLLYIHIFFFKSALDQTRYKISSLQNNKFFVKWVFCHKIRSELFINIIYPDAFEIRQQYVWWIASLLNGKMMNVFIDVCSSAIFSKCHCWYFFFIPISFFYIWHIKESLEYKKLERLNVFLMVTLKWKMLRFVILYINLLGSFDFESLKMYVYFVDWHNTL